jgi:MFS family permease
VDIRKANFVSMVVYGLFGVPGLILGGIVGDSISTIQDVIEPSLRGTAMALYFFAMYVLGASLGPYRTGLASDFFARRAASAAGATILTHQALEPFRAAGLHSAMYIIPVLGVLLTLVLFAASGTVTKDMEKLQLWMRESIAADALAESAEVEAAGASPAS